MTLQEFDRVMDEMFLACNEVMKSKGLAYSGKEDKLGNFKRCAKLSGTDIDKVWFTYFIKHFDSLCSYIRGEYSDSEPIKGRIIDMINYLYLYAGILKEQGKL